MNYVENCHKDLLDCVTLVNSQFHLLPDACSYGLYLLTILAHLMRHGPNTKFQPTMNFDDAASTMRRMMEIHGLEAGKGEKLEICCHSKEDL